MPAPINSAVDGSGMVLSVMVIDQPPAIEPLLPTWSSKTNSPQAPFGFVPLNRLSVAPYGPPGAGAANASPPPKFVGR
jgi:hypothetical protein